MISDIDVDVNVNIAIDEEHWQDYFLDMKNQYRDWLIEDETDNSNERPESESPPDVDQYDLAGAIYEGSLTTLGMSLFAIISFAVKNSIR